MRLSLNWLKEFVEIEVPFSQLLNKLDMIGLLVEDWEEKDGDIILEIETYANRPDTLGHLGVAREIAAAFGLELKKQNWPLIETDEKTSDLIDIQIWDENLCPRYCGIIVKGMKVEPSPLWLKKKIEAMGLKSINNVVDVTNYVLFATSQPIHAFDLDKLSGKKILIRKAKKGEVLKTLEGKEVSLLPEMLVIADERKPVALAGIIGGEESAVSETTQNVFIESAYFDPVSVRKTSKAIGISTDASYRFERGADISFPPQASLICASFLSQMGGKVTKELIDIYPKKRKTNTLILRKSRINALLGIEVEKEFVERTLNGLGFQVKGAQGESWQVGVPFHRVDVEREADLIEEIARFYGYDKIPARIPPLRELEFQGNERKKRLEKLRHLLFHHGFDEVVNYSFSDEEKEAILKTSRRAIQIKNPFSQRASLLRTTLVGGLLENIRWNKNRGLEGINIFEIGNIYFWENETTRERLFLALATTGEVEERNWASEKERADFFKLKGVCEAIMGSLRYQPFSFSKENHSFFKEGYSLALKYKGETIGFLGSVRAQILSHYSLEGEVWAAELELAGLLEKQPQPFHYVPVARFPAVSRDISFLLDEDIPFEEIKNTLEKLSLPCLERFELYDRFSGSILPRGKVSLSLRFLFRHPQKTLLSEEVDGYQKKIIDILKANFNIQLREGGKIDK